MIKRRELSSQERIPRLPECTPLTEASLKDDTAGLQLHDLRGICKDGDSGSAGVQGGRQQRAAPCGGRTRQRAPARATGPAEGNPGVGCGPQLTERRASQLDRGPLTAHRAIRRAASGGGRHGNSLAYLTLKTYATLKDKVTPCRSSAVYGTDSMTVVTQRPWNAKISRGGDWIRAGDGRPGAKVQPKEAFMVAASPEEGFCEDSSHHTHSHLHARAHSHTHMHTLSHSHTLREHQPWARRCTGAVCAVTARSPGAG